MKRTHWVELLLCLGVVAAAFAFAVKYTHDRVDTDTFWSRFAIGVAEGQGAKAPIDNPVLEDFIAHKSERIAPEAVPHDVQWANINPFAETHLYLIYTCGWFLRLGGMDWNSLKPLFGLLYAGACLAVYGIFRLAMGRGLALLGVMFFALTPIHLTMLPHLRDYSKAPFILGLIFVLGVAVRREAPWRSRAALALGIAAGALIGVGLGMRQDLQVCLLPATLVFACFLPGHWRATWRQRALALAAMYIVFVLASFPVLGAMQRGGGNPAHNVLGGFSEECSLEMGYAEPGAELQPIFLDGYIGQTIRAHARYALDAPAPVTYLSKDYDAAGKKLVVAYARVFPYNMLQRAIAAFRTVIMNTPLEHGMRGFPVTPELQRVLDAGFPWWYYATRLAPLTLAFALAACLWRSLRLGLCVGLLIAFFCTYPVLQYHPRHAFHLSFFAWWALLLLVQLAGRGGMHAATPEGRKRLRAQLAFNVVRKPMLRVVVVTVLLFAAVALPLAAARAVQGKNSSALVDGMKAIPKARLASEVAKDAEAGWSNVTVSGVFPDAPSPEDTTWGFSRRIIALEFAGNTPEIPVRIAYAVGKDSADFGFETTVSLSSDGGPHHVWFYLPVYRVVPTPNAGAADLGQSEFSGVALPTDAAQNLRGVYLLAHDPALPLYARLDDIVPADLATRGNAGAFIPKGSLRSALSQINNRLANGDMERWNAEGTVPEGCQAPQAASSITRETEQTRRGRAAVKQVWSDTDSRLSPLQRFGVTFAGIEGGHAYDICVDSLNTGNQPVAVDAWVVLAPPGQQPQVALLRAALFVVRPGTAYAPYIATINLPAQLPQDVYLLLTTVAPTGTTPGTTVYWDSWRIAPTP